MRLDRGGLFGAESHPVGRGLADQVSGLHRHALVAAPRDSRRSSRIALHSTRGPTQMLHPPSRACPIWRFTTRPSRSVRSLAIASRSRVP